MINDVETVNLLAALAQEVEITDPIDWGHLAIDETNAYRLMASHVVENFSSNQERIVLLATITKLLVENFVLNLKLEGMNNNASRTYRN